MGTRDPKVDAYIEKAAPFARPILEHIREIVHGTCPDVEEAIKWSHPFFLYKGMLCHMAAFKEHCAFGFWKRELVTEDESDADKREMGQFGRIGNVRDLPSKKVLTGYIKQAMKLNEEGVVKPRPPKPRVPKPVEVPIELERA